MNQQKLNMFHELFLKRGELDTETALEVLEYQELSEEDWEQFLDYLYHREVKLQPSAGEAPGRQEAPHRFAAMYLDSLRQMPTPSEEDFEAMFIEVKENEDPAVDKLTEAFLPYIAECAVIWHPQQSSMVQDLIGEGCAGALYTLKDRTLLDEITDAQAFRNAVNWWINGYMFKYIYTGRCASQIAGHLAEQMNRVMQARSRLTASLGHAPSAAEIAGETGLDQAEVMTILGELKIQEQNANAGPTLLRQTRNEDIDDAADRIGFEEDIDQLEIEERYVLQVLYGIGGRPRLTAEEAAVKMNIPIETVRDIEARALSKLKKIKEE